MPGDRVDPAVESYVASAPPDVRAILVELLELVLETLPEAATSIKRGRPVFSVGSDLCYLAKARGHATLGFFRGVELDDPAGMLEGSGERLRHVKVRSGAEVPRGALRDFLVDARRLTRG